MGKNYWQILGLEENASLDEIKIAYRKCAKKFHPDLHNNDEFFTEKFKEIQEAYAFLSKATTQEEREHAKGPSNLSEPQIIHFTSSCYEASIGDIITLSWKILNADKVYLAKIGSVSSIASKKIKIKQFKNGYCTFELIASNTLYTVNSKIQVKEIELKGPKIINFSTNTIRVFNGEQVIITWEVKNAKKVTCSDIAGELPLIGKQTITVWFYSNNYKYIHLYAHGVDNNCLDKFIKISKINLTNETDLNDKINHEKKENESSCNWSESQYVGYILIFLLIFLFIFSLLPYSLSKL